METSDSEVVQTGMKVEWKSATIMHGVQCVMMPGGLLMLVWPADSLDFHQQVNIRLHFICFRMTCDLSIITWT